MKEMLLEKFIENCGFKDNESCIGKGTDGYVTSITHTQTHQQFALKVVKLNTIKSTEHFLNEAAIMMKLRKNDNIIKTKSFSINKKNKEGYIIMEKLDTDLLKYILAKGKLSEQEAKLFFKQICGAICYAHSQQIAHLDMKPENVLINLQTKKVKICDFFRSYQWSGDKIMVNAGELITKEYRAPEVLGNDEYRVDKLDQWSAGVMLFTMVTGSFPFVVSTDINVKGYNIDIQNYEQFLQKIGVSHVCYDLLTQLLNQNPSERPSFQTIMGHPFFTL